MLAMPKNKVDVLIGGNVYSLQGTESKEHIQKVAGLIDKHMLAVKKSDLAHRLSSSQVHMLAAINLADDYLKLQETFVAYEKELEKCSQENILLNERIREMALEINRLKVNKRHK